jgi:hypothetical protein
VTEKHHAYYWGQLDTLVKAYAFRNCKGFLEVWGMLADKYDEGRGTLYDEMLNRHLSLYDAVSKLGITKDLLETAYKLFMVKADGVVW